MASLRNSNFFWEKIPKEVQRGGSVAFNMANKAGLRGLSEETCLDKASADIVTFNDESRASLAPNSSSIGFRQVGNPVSIKNSARICRIKRFMAESFHKILCRNR